MVLMVHGYNGSNYHARSWLTMVLNYSRPRLPWTDHGKQGLFVLQG